MKKLIIGGIVFTVALLGIVYFSIIGQDADALKEVGSSINLYSAIAAVVIVAVSVAVVLKYVNQMQNDTASGEDSGHSWDGIKEYKNDLPKGWAIMFIILIVWFIYYVLVKYPVGTYSQIGEYNDEVKELNAKFEQKHQNLTDEERVRMGKSIFSVNCAPCHGATADGMGTAGRETLKAENLQVRTLTKAYVLKVMKEGSTQLGFGDGDGMPSQVDDVEAKDFDAVAEYVAGGLKGTQPTAFADTCAGCHGENGEGDEDNPSLVAYSADWVNTFLSNGSKKADIGKMPAFKDTLNATQIRAVSAYVANLKGKE